MNAKFPPPLKPKGTIGVISPGRWPKPEWITRGKVLLEKRGYKVVVHPQNYKKNGQLAGSDAARAGAIMDMFADRSIDAIICARGGTGSLRLLDKLDYKIIKRNPKPFIGYSDITVLLQAISKRCGFVTYHGPMLVSFFSNPEPRMMDEMLAAVGGKKNMRLKFSGIDCVKTGQVEGRLVGGNLTLLEYLIGTPYDWSAKDAILFIEDTEEVIYKLADKLQHLKLAGKFSGAKAIIIGEMVDIGDGETGFAQKGDRPFGKTLREVFLDILPKDVPLCFDYPCGHGKYHTTLPFSAKVMLKLSARGAGMSFGSF